MKNLTDEQLRAAFNNTAKLFSIFNGKCKEMELHIEFMYNAIQLELRLRTREEQNNKINQ